MKPTLAIAVIVGGLFASSIAAFAEPIAVSELPPTPRLLLNPTEIDALKQKIAGPFAGQWAQWLAKADKLVSDPVELPPRGGNWSHNYVCPVHGARLKLGKKIGPWQWEHICPVGNHVLYGDPTRGATDFDGNAIMDAHLAYADAMITLGVAYRITGQARYLDRAKEILLAYAVKYRTYPFHGKWIEKQVGKEGGHVSTQPLTEATWLISMTQGADLIWDKLDNDERNNVTEKLMLPALHDSILPINYGLHNMQCRMNSAIGLVGLLLGDQELIHTAIDDPKSGFREQINHGVLDDGMWLEGSNGYHFFTLEGLWPLAEAARHCGIDLYSPRYKMMFDAPFDFSTPDLLLPNFNDSEIVDMKLHADVYELAYARWHDARYLPIVTAGKRTSILSLLYGVDVLPAESAQPRSMHSHNSLVSGYAVLTKGSATDAAWCCLKYGPFGGMHGHDDKNSFVLYSASRLIAADAGTHAYGSPLHTDWDKTSIAHNTLSVDENSQAPARGSCLAFGSQTGVDYAMTDAGPIDPDHSVKFVRTLAMVDANTLLGIDQVTTDGKPHTLDIAFHLPGAWNEAADGQPWHANPKTPYRFIEPATIRPLTAGSQIALNIKNKDRTTTLTLLGCGQPTEIITGSGVGESTEDHVPAVVVRRTAPQAVFVWAITFDGSSPKLSVNTDAAQVAVSLPKGLQVIANPAARSVTIRRMGL